MTQRRTPRRLPRGRTREGTRSLPRRQHPFYRRVFRFTYDGLDDLLSIVKDTDDASDVVVDPYPAEAFERDLQRVTGGRTDPLLSRALIDRSYKTVRRMADFDVRFEFSRAVTGIRIPVSNKTRLQPGAAILADHEGIGLSHTLFDLAAKNGIEVLYERQVNRILCDDTGRVFGVEARGPSGLERHHGRAVIRRERRVPGQSGDAHSYLGGPWDLVKTRGSRYNTGEVIRELLAVRAQSFGDWAGRHATPLDADAPAYGDLKLTDKTNRLSYPYGILVNLDSRALPLLEKRYETGIPVETASFDELVAGIDRRYPMLGLDTVAMLKTIVDYNWTAGAKERGRYDYGLSASAPAKAGPASK
jgi:hypothetical protein